MKKRTRFRVVYNKREREWELWQGKLFIHYAQRKADAVKLGRLHARDVEPSQLVIRNKNGTIQTEYTYGADPRRHRG